MFLLVTTLSSYLQLKWILINTVWPRKKTIKTLHSLLKDCNLCRIYQILSTVSGRLLHTDLKKAWSHTWYCNSADLKIPRGERQKMFRPTGLLVFNLKIAIYWKTTGTHIRNYRTSAWVIRVLAWKKLLELDSLWKQRLKEQAGISDHHNEKKLHCTHMSVLLTQSPRSQVLTAPI